ncbi:TPA: histone deacetylase [Candidatus Bipolaricaulota bacterium]|nr:histone deacetylase [Candidatus Bipolaricaulota bacterium]
MRAFHSDGYSVRLPEGHPFPIEKYGLVLRRLVDGGILRAEWLQEAEPVDPRLLALVHQPEYLERLFRGEMGREELRRLGLPWSKEMVLRASASVGATIEAAWAALEAEDGIGVGVNLGGGTHHAFPDRGEAFCIFNDITIAIRLLQQRKALKRSVIIDLDVHQGDGTAAILRYDPDIFILDIYCEENFPSRKVRTDIGLGLPEGTGDEEYLKQLKKHLPKALEFGPDLAFYQAGVDPLEEDSLGGLALSHEGLLERDRLVLQACREAGVPVVITLGGGYARPITETVRAHLNTIAVARELFT